MIMTEPALLANRWQAPDGTIVQSHHRHDFVEYAGGFVDGGIDYIRLGAKAVKWKDLCVYSNDPHVVIREAFTWGTRGKDGNQPVRYVLLKDLTEEHIEAILETQWQIPNYIRKVFEDELKYRKDGE